MDASYATGRDPGFRVEGYVRRADARSALFWEAGDARPLPPAEAFKAWAADADCGIWIERLHAIESERISQLLGRLPDSEVSGPAVAFAQELLEVSRGRILEAL